MGGSVHASIDCCRSVSRNAGRPERGYHPSTPAMRTRLISRAFHDPIFAKRLLKHVTVLHKRLIIRITFDKMSIAWRSQKTQNSKRNETVLADWVSAGDMLPDYIGLPFLSQLASRSGKKTPWISTTRPRKRLNRSSSDGQLERSTARDSLRLSYDTTHYLDLLYFDTRNTLICFTLLCNITDWFYDTTEHIPVGNTICMQLSADKII